MPYLNQDIKRQKDNDRDDGKVRIDEDRFAMQCQAILKSRQLPLLQDQVKWDFTLIYRHA